MENTAKTNGTSNTPTFCTTTRKIGNTTFLVSSRFKEGQEGDIISTFARLAQYDADGTCKPKNNRKSV